MILLVIFFIGESNIYLFIINLILVFSLVCDVISFFLVCVYSSLVGVLYFFFVDLFNVKFLNMSLEIVKI